MKNVLKKEEQPSFLKVQDFTWNSLKKIEKTYGENSKQNILKEKNLLQAVKDSFVKEDQVSHDSLKDYQSFQTKFNEFQTKLPDEEEEKAELFFDQNQSVTSQSKEKEEEQKEAAENVPQEEQKEESFVENESPLPEKEDLQAETAEKPDEPKDMAFSEPLTSPEAPPLSHLMEEKEALEKKFKKVLQELDELKKAHNQLQEEQKNFFPQLNEKMAALKDNLIFDFLKIMSHKLFGEKVIFKEDFFLERLKLLLKKFEHSQSIQVQINDHLYEKIQPHLKKWNQNQIQFQPSSNLSPSDILIEKDQKEHFLQSLEEDLKFLLNQIQLHD